MTPNFLLFPEWGKLLFSIADVGIVYLIYAVRLELERRKPKVAQFCAHSVGSDCHSSDEIDDDGNSFTTSSIESDSDTNDRNDIMHLNINSKNQNLSNHQNQNQNQNRNNRSTSNTSSKSCIRTSCSVAWMWALNPLAINICTRGSADSLTNCLVLALLYYLLQQSKKYLLICFCFFFAFLFVFIFYFMFFFILIFTFILIIIFIFN